MKDFLAGLIGGTIGMFLAIFLYVWLGNNDETPCLQQQAGYQVALTSQTKLLTTQIDLLAKERARAGLLQASHTALQQEFAIRLAQQVVIPEPKAMLVSQLEPIEDLAARMAPVEAAVKQQATDNHEFIPAAFRSYWGKVLAQGLMRK